MRSTVHTTYGYYHGKKAFTRDMILQVNKLANLESIKARKNHTTQKFNIIKNDKKILHPYLFGDKVLIINKKSNLRSKILSLTQGPFEVLDVFGNGTLKFEKVNTYKKSNFFKSNLNLVVDLSHIKNHTKNIIMYQSEKLHSMDTHTRNGLDATKRAGPKSKIIGTQIYFSIDRV